MEAQRNKRTNQDPSASSDSGLLIFFTAISSSESFQNSNDFMKVYKISKCDVSYVIFFPLSISINLI